MIRTTLKLILFVCLALTVIHAYARDIWVRPDGGTLIVNGVGECDGSVNLPKNATKKCAATGASLEMTYSPTAGDYILIGAGKWQVTVREPTQWITMDQFVKNPTLYTDKIKKKGTKVIIQNYNGASYNVVLYQ